MPWCGLGAPKSGGGACSACTSRAVGSLGPLRRRPPQVRSASTANPIPVHKVANTFSLLPSDCLPLLKVQPLQVERSLRQWSSQRVEDGLDPVSQFTFSRARCSVSSSAMPVRLSRRSIAASPASIHASTRFSHNLRRLSQRGNERRSRGLRS